MQGVGVVGDWNTRLVFSIEDWKAYIFKLRARAILVKNKVRALGSTPTFLSLKQRRFQACQRANIS